ncbi:MAG: hypothetical protein ACE5KW_05880, partial [Dehalococcoidia bacterium]
MAARLAPALNRTVSFITKSGIWDLALISFAFLFRGGMAASIPDAYSRAIDIVELERRMGLFWEKDMQAWIMSSRH